MFPQILVIVGLTHALVVFRVIVAGFLAKESWEFLSSNSQNGAMMLGAVFHYLIITVMTRVHRSVKIVSLLPHRDSFCNSNYVFVFAGQQDCSHEALWNRYV